MRTEFRLGKKGQFWGWMVVMRPPECEQTECPELNT